MLAKAAGKKILVLGDMGELGDSARFSTSASVYESRLAGIDKIFTLGELSVYTAASFGTGARHFGRMEELLTEVESCWLRMLRC